jgi:hypothetical protein
MTNPFQASDTGAAAFAHSAANALGLVFPYNAPDDAYINGKSRRVYARELRDLADQLRDSTDP